ncbi:unnamed protein product [Brassicogethes aeneus]|uniref:Uncharacterized protein n=1 Tax=Brassicogethes aeneus TaxID=1431903 RepID=A0A9P0AZC8_BRAAE|nr:unnamed protein product [Brassicogethes aeneus]
MLRKDNEAQELLLKENERKMKDAKVKSFDLKNSNNNKNEFITATQLASSKIVELTKKLREKNCEVESLKTKCAKLEAAISESDVLKEKDGSNNSSPHEVSKLEQKIGLLQRENIELKHSNDDLSKRCNVLKTKLKMVENEYGLIKTRYYSLNEQSERDQEFIDNLSSQLAHTKDLQSDGFKSRDKKIKKLKLENDALLSNVEKFKCQYDNATKLLDEKCREIEEIKKQKGQNLELKVEY